jgi:hypothetical protein
MNLIGCGSIYSCSNNNANLSECIINNLISKSSCDDPNSFEFTASAEVKTIFVKKSSELISKIFKELALNFLFNAFDLI